MGTIGHYGNLSFFPPFLASNVQFILGLSPSFFALSLPGSPFFSVSVAPENLGSWRSISTQHPLGRCVCCGGTPVQEDAGVRGGCLRGPRLVSRRDRCFPGYSGNSSGVSSCFDSKTSATSGCPVLCRQYTVPHSFLQTSYLFLLPTSPNPECLKHGAQTC